MPEVRGIYRNGTIEWQQPPGLVIPEGAKVSVRLMSEREWKSLPDNDIPYTPEEIEAQCARIDAWDEPIPENDLGRILDEMRAEQKAWEIANAEIHDAKLEKLFS